MLKNEVNVCWFCNHRKYRNLSDQCAGDYGEDAGGYYYCEVLEKGGEIMTARREEFALGADFSEECGSFAWNCDMEQIVRELKQLNDRYDELSSAKHELVIMRKGKISDEFRSILNQVRAMKQPKE